MELVSLTTAIIASLLLVIASLGFLRARDLFNMSHIIMVSNCYIVPLLLISIGMKELSLLSSAKILALILLNIIIANLLCYNLLRKTPSDKVMPNIEKEDS
jgi:multisubunit Na+/H+ antiporter MnhG subunit